MSSKSKIVSVGVKFMFILIFALLLLLYNATWEHCDRLETVEQRDDTPIATATPLSKDDIEKLEIELPEVDFTFWYHKAKPQNYGSSCARYPDPFDLQLHNFYWQTFINANVTFRLYAAYLDKRAGVESSRGVVRVLATANQIDKEFPLTHCQLWYADHKEPIVTPISEYLSVWPIKWGQWPLLSYPHLLSCPVPEDLPRNLANATPSTVSLTRESCELARNSLRVHYERATVANISSSSSSSFSSSRITSSNSTPSRTPNSNFSSLFNTSLSIGVCIKGFDFPFEDVSQRLIEWFELQRILGASRIYAYMYNVHPAVQRVLDYYQRTGYLELRPLTMANGAPRLPYYLHQLIQNRLMVKRLNELIPYNDCFYRNMYRHDYMLNVDIDEVIMPLGQLRSWQDVIEADQQLTKANCSNGHDMLCFINAHFSSNLKAPDDHPDELYLLRNTMRLRNYTRKNVATKCFHNTRFSLTLHNHYTIKSLPGCCKIRFVGTDLAHIQHYRDKNKMYQLSEMIEDRSIWKFAKELRRAVDHVQLQVDYVSLDLS